ncbi:hypothetical protein RRG08_015376 [Elysia crispata]|uniref:EF-hand domain-containing protein n=1 Tax=Elysia crispata TaxID=231223 RepID=A0AAE0YS98_9GAST|nr:hypothetical protein RRG08_015376 [Elysia crispata]
MAYPGYGSPPGGWQPSAPPPGMDPFYQYFSAVAGADGQISVSELQRCLNSLNWTQFSESTCQIMISMLDRDRSGQMGYNEFKELWPVLQQWRGTFVRLDTNKSGYIEAAELGNALRGFGYNVSPQFVNLVLLKFDYETRSRLNLDQFVMALIMLRGLTDAFRKRDVSQSGQASFAYDEFMSEAIYHKP